MQHSSQFIPRDAARPEDEDFRMNVQPKTGPYRSATPSRDQTGDLKGWHLQPIEHE